MGYKLTDADIASKLVGVNFTGNIIPSSWFKVLKTGTKNPKPYLQAIIILSDVVFWYRPTIVRDEENPENYWYEKKYQGELLQRSYKQLQKMFGFTPSQSRRALVFLESFSLVERQYADVLLSNGDILSNVMYIYLNIEKLIEITFPGGYSKILEYPILKNHNTLFQNLEGIHRLHNTEKTNTDVKGGNSSSDCDLLGEEEVFDHGENISSWGQPKIEQFIIGVCGLNITPGIKRVGDVKSMLLRNGVEKTKDGLRLAFDEWCKCKNKETKQPYNPYNPNWIEWGVEYLLNGNKRWEIGSNGSVSSSEEGTYL